MGYLLNEALKILCGVNQWSYAVFWKIGSQNPKLLIWEECYYGPITYSGLPHISGIESSELAIEDWEACWVSNEVCSSQLGVQAGDIVHSLLNKMKHKRIHAIGQGLAGQAAFTGNHQWICSENHTIETHPPEVLNEVYEQFSAGMQTVAVIPILPHGVVQLGSSSAIMEDMGFVNKVKTLVHQLGYVCGALSPDNYTTKESALKSGVSISHGNSVSTGLCGRSNVTNSSPSTADYVFSGSCDDRHNSVDEKCTLIELAKGKVRVENDLFQALSIPMTPQDEHLRSSEQSYEHQSSTTTNSKYENSCVRPSSGDDLFDILGVDVKSKLFNGSWNDFISNGPHEETQNFDKNNHGSESFQGVGSDMYPVNEGNPESGIFSATDSDNLLDAVVSRAHSAAKQTSEDNLSCGSTSTKKSSSSTCIASSSQANASNRMQEELLGLNKSLTKTLALGSCSISQTNSNYGSGSQISSWVEQGYDMKRCSSVSTAYTKRPVEMGKSNRKRQKPGENPRPRPKDRQMIQDRVKELREIVPSGAKCSIDALLERTIKHMLFLQCVRKHADKLNQTRESKFRSREGGLILKDNIHGGATWAYEVGSQSMVCPIIVEDLNPPRQFLIEMLCEKRGLFLEIADIVRGLGLTILKGMMDTRSDKIWACFTVEAKRDVTRMEIFISLVRLLEQTSKTSSASANCINNDNTRFSQSLHQATSIPATGMPRSFQ